MTEICDLCSSPNLCLLLDHPLKLCVEVCDLAIIRPLLTIINGAMTSIILSGQECSSLLQMLQLSDHHPRPCFLFSTIFTCHQHRVVNVLSLVFPLGFSW